MKILALAALTLSVATFATERQFIFTASNCLLLERQAEAILAWSQKLDPSFNAALPQCQCDGPKCSIDLYSVSPPLVKMYHKKYSDVSGPNCWNRALVFAKILPSLSYSTPEEMSLWMNSPLCQLREEGETPQAGDIVAIRSYMNDEVHGFTYLTDQLSFSKNGFHKSSPYAYESTASVFSVYGVKKECWNIPFTPSTSSSCFRARGSFFNCQSLEGYIESSNQEPSEFVTNTLQSLAQMGQTIEEQLFELSQTDIDFYRQLYEDISEIGEIASNMKANSDLNQLEQFLWKACYHRSLALMQQLSMIAGQIG